MSAVVAEQKAHLGGLTFTAIEAVVGSLATVIAVALGVDSAIVPAIVASVALIPPAFVLIRSRRRRKGAVEISALGRGEVQRPIIAIVFVMGLGLVLIESIIFGAIGYVIGVSAPTIEWAQNGYYYSTIIVGYPAFAISAFVFSTRISHYILRWAWLWWAVSLVIYAVVRGALILTQLGNPLFEGLNLVITLVQMIVVVFVFYGICMAGWWFSRRYHLEFVAARLLRALSAGDKSAALELLREASSVTPPAERVEPETPAPPVAPA